MDNLIFEKTPKGLSELEAYSRDLDLSLRKLLIFIDGKHSVHQLMRQYSALGIDHYSFTRLLKRGLISVKSQEPALNASATSNGETPLAKMGGQFVFEKTEKGRQELQSHSRQLGHNLRRLLVLVDGEKTADELIRGYEYLGIDHRSILRLMREGFIKPHPFQATTIRHAGADGTPSVAKLLNEDELAKQKRYATIYRYFVDTLSYNAGEAGHALLAQVQDTQQLEQLVALRDVFYETISRVKGKTIANGVRARLDQLILGTA